jgi:hypothetical protein
LYGNTTPEGRSVFIQFRVFPTSTSVDITIYQYGKIFLYFFYNIAMSKARRIRKNSVFTSGGKFPVLTLSYINTALSQSAFRIYKCYIIKCFIPLLYNDSENKLFKLLSASNNIPYDLRENRHFIILEWKTNRCRNTFIVSNCK